MYIEVTIGDWRVIPSTAVTAVRARSQIISVSAPDWQQHSSTPPSTELHYNIPTRQPRHGIHPAAINVSPQSGRVQGIPAFRPTLHQHLQKYLEWTKDKNIIYTRKKIINKPYKNTHYISTQCMEEQNSAVDCSSCSYMILVQFKRRHCWGVWCGCWWQQLVMSYGPQAADPDWPDLVWRIPTEIWRTLGWFVGQRRAQSRGGTRPHVVWV